MYGQQRTDFDYYNHLICQSNQTQTQTTVFNIPERDSATIHMTNYVDIIVNNKHRVEVERYAFYLCVSIFDLP